MSAMAEDKSDRFLVQFKNNVYDISEFAHKHPGGQNTLKGLNNTDMGARFMKAPPHSDAAMYLMQEYKVRATAKNNNTNSNNDKNGISNGKNGISNDKNGISNGKNGISNGKNGMHQNGSNGHVSGDLNKEFFEKPDDSMEHLVDWSSAMIPQISKIKEQYAEWVNKPVDRPLRLFGPDWLEMLTKTPWWVIPSFWIPMIFYICRTGVAEAMAKDYSTSVMALSLIGGIFLWTVVEYTLHRWVFHLDAENASGFTCTFHFLLHGLHHKVPFDPYRLVFPPVPAMFLASLFYVPLTYIFGCPKIVISGGLIGYLCYDMIHYYIHYGSPAGGYMYNLKRYHYQHHFVHHDKGFGISSPVWDDVFGTKILLRKLKYLLKW